MYIHRIVLFIIILVCHFNCPAFASNSYENLNPAEKRVIDQIKIGKAADFTRDPEDKRILTADFLKDLLTGSFYGLFVPKEGIRVHGARIKEKLDFTGEEIPFPVSLLGCIFDKNVLFYDTKFHGDASFASAEFHGDTSFSYAEFDENVSFLKAKFSGKAEFSATEFWNEANFRLAKFCEKDVFEGAKFCEKASFKLAKFSKKDVAVFGGAKFHGDAFFKSAKFSKKAEFDGAKFFKNVLFKNADFHGDTSFEYAEFYRKAEFTATIFYKRASFKLAKFSKETVAVFRGAKFKEDASFAYSEFKGDTYFSSAEFSGDASFLKAEFLGKAEFSEAKFYKKTSFYETIMPKANLSKAELHKANLSHADLSEATLSDADLKDCIFYSAKLPFIYEPKAGSPPYIPSIASLDLPNLSALTFKRSPHGLVDLREGFKKLGYREQERKITYAIKHTQRRKLWNDSENNEKDSVNSSSILNKFESIFYLVFFELTCEYGMKPGRPFLILIGFIFLFTFPYTEFISRKGKDGVWKVWIEERVRKNMGTKEPEPQYFLGIQALRTGFYFSLLSAFSIGWRELNVGNWIARMQRREYVLKATGWARVFSGIQSIISMYLLVLGVLTYFGRPFEAI